MLLICTIDLHEVKYAPVAEIPVVYIITEVYDELFMVIRYYLSEIPVLID